MKFLANASAHFTMTPTFKASFCLLAVILTANSFGQELFSPPDSNISLSEKWAWGSALALDSNENNAWVAYQFSTELDEKIEVAISSYENDYFQWNNHRRGNNWFYRDSNSWSNGLSIQSILAGNENSQQNFLLPRDLMFLANFRYGELREIRVVDARSVISWRQSPVYWLGRVSEEESFRFLIGLVGSSSSSGINRALLRAVGLHGDPDRTPYLNQAFNEEELPDVRAAVLESLALQESAEVLSILTSVAEDDNEAILTRRIAISALSRYDSMEVESLLIDLASSLNPQTIRREALESLGGFHSADVTQTLRSVVLNESNADVVEEALRSLSLRPDQFETISTVAQNHDHSEIREEAISVLGNMDIYRAFEILTSIAETDDNIEVREEAIEEIEDGPEALAVPYLIAFAEAEDQHPTDVRKEAVDSLSNFDAALVLAPLRQLAWADNDEDIREEAVDSLADLESIQANALLLDIAKNHPSSHTRNEALDRLQDNLF